MTRFTKVAAAGSTSAAVDDTGHLWVTGANTHGQLGVGDIAARHRFVRVPLTDIVDVDVSVTHIVALDAHGGAYAAGRRSRNGGAPITRFTRITDRAVAVAAGPSTVAYIRSDGDLWASGAGPDGPLSCEVSVHTRISGPDDLVDVACDGGTGAHLALRADGTIITWRTAATDRAATTGAAANTFRATAITAGTQFHAAIDDTGTAWFTGQHGYGNPLHHGDPGSYHRLAGHQIATMSTAVSHSLFVDTDGQLWECDGDSAGLERVDVAFRAVDVAAGARHSLVIDTDGQLWGAGLAVDGQLGCLGAYDTTFTRLEVDTPIGDLAAELADVDTPISVTLDTARTAYTT
jgi:alpha-tubulin suppressor-like RCC1 family protein